MKVLVYSPVAPSVRSSGALMLYQLLSLNRKERFYCFCAVDPIRKTRVELPGKNIQIKLVRRPIENAIRLTRSAIDAPLGYIFEKIKDIYIDQVLVRQAVKYGQKNSVDCVWAILQGKTVIRSALKISQQLKVPLKCQIWDEPNWIFKDTNLDQISLQNALKIYHKTLTRSEIIACASFAMAEKYREFGRPTVIFLGSMANPPRIKFKKNKTFDIGFAGQIYAKHEWNCLIQTLNLMNWKVGSRNVKIILLGNFKKNSFSTLPIKVLGYKSQKEALKILSQVDLNYCPYWFDKEHKNITETSFPSKLTTYLACRRPVILHAPLYSSPAKFLKSNHCGFLCGSLKPEELSRAILEIESGNYDLSLLNNQKVAFDKYLTFDFQKKQFNKFLKINNL